MTIYDQLRTDVDIAETAAAGDADTITSLRAEVARLQAIIDGAPTPTRTLVGVDLQSPPAANESLHKGREQVARIFYKADVSGVDPATDRRVTAALDRGAQALIVSHKDIRPGPAEQFYGRLGALGVPVWSCLRHEPENDGRPAAEWRDQWAQHSPLMRAAGLRPVPILMIFTLYAKDRNISDWLLDPALIDATGFDVYLWGRDPAKCAADTLAVAARQGRPLLVGELGDERSDPTRPQRVRTFLDAVAGQAVAVAWWNRVGAAGDATLDAATASVLFG